MRNNRHDVVETAHRVLDEYGLGDLTMRRVAAELDVQPSALYHHFPGKQALLAAVADHILSRTPLAPPATEAPAAPESAEWLVRLRRAAGRLRDSLLACRDGAELVATVQAYGLGTVRPDQVMAGILTEAGISDDFARVSARTMLFYVLGHVTDEQVNMQAGSAGAIVGDVHGELMRTDSDFDLGVDLVLGGITAHVRAGR